MLDPLTALSLAGTIIQFVDFGTKLLSNTQQFYQRGSLSAHDELRIIATNVNDIFVKLRQVHHSSGVAGCLTRSEQQLLNICEASAKIGDQILGRLERLKIQGFSGNHGTTSNGFQIVCKSLKAMWSRKDLEEMLRRLEKYQTMLHTYILVDLREHRDISDLQQSRRFDSLQADTQTIITALLDNRNVATDDLDDQTRMIAAMLNRMELVVQDSHDKTRAIFADVLANGDFTTFTSTNHEHAATLLRKDEERVSNIIAHSILEKLHFQTMTHRHEEVALKHKRTFDWIFRSTSPKQLPWTNFAEWLRDGEGTYWINGKAGSGKSTLMRYIYDVPRTEQELLSWAGDIPLTTAGFFFWNSGTLEQRSLVGLLRSLLHEVLSKHHDLIPVVLPWYWAKGYLEASNVDSPMATVLQKHYMTEDRLLQAFFTLITQNIVPLKLCLFIDGLDEFEGDHGRIADMFKDISSSPYVKVCISSRPLLVLEDAFRSCPGLRLQDLTFEDIQSYVNEELRSNRAFVRLAEEEPLKAPALVQEIVLKAEGVFLWVTLVVKSLLSGLGNRDSIEDLQIRLRLLPSELEALYDHMLFKRVDKFYIAKTSRIFQILRAGREQRDSITSDGEKLQPLSTLSLSFAEEDPETAINAKIKTLSTDDMNKRCILMEDRLKVRCAGLLEIQGLNAEKSDESRKTIAARVDGKIQYLHRTVRDYLEKEDVWQTLLSYTANTDFHPYRSLLISHILHLKLGDPPSRASDLMYTTSLAMLCAQKSDYATSQPSVALVESLDSVANFWCNQGERPLYPILNRQWTGTLSQWKGGLGSEHNWNMHWRDSLLSLSVQYGLHSYVEEKLTKDPRLIIKEGRPLLHYAIDPGKTFDHHISSHMVKRIVRLGGNPGQCFEGLSSWQMIENAVSDLMSGHRFSDDERSKLLEWLDVVIALVDSQGNELTNYSTTGKDVKTTTAEDDHSTLDAIVRLLESRVPVETARLKQIIKLKAHHLDITKQGDGTTPRTYAVLTQTPMGSANQHSTQQTHQYSSMAPKHQVSLRQNEVLEPDNYSNFSLFDTQHPSGLRTAAPQRTSQRQAPILSDMIYQPSILRVGGYERPKGNLAVSPEPIRQFSHQASQYFTNYMSHLEEGLIEESSRSTNPSYSSVSKDNIVQEDPRHVSRHSTSTMSCPKSSTPSHSQTPSIHSQASPQPGLYSKSTDISQAGPRSDHYHNFYAVRPESREPRNSQNPSLEQSRKQTYSQHSGSPISTQNSQHFSQHSTYANTLQSSVSQKTTASRPISHRASYRVSHQPKKSLSIFTKLKRWNQKE